MQTFTIYVLVALTSDGRQDEELDTRIGKANACFALFGCHETRIVEKGKALNFKTVFVLILSYGHKS